MAIPRWHIETLESTASTNDDARRAAETGAAEGFVVTAARQTTGRGRLGRIWESQAGNLYASALLRPKNMPSEAGLYSFVAALAVYDTVTAILPEADITLKWPNDVIVNGKKISGILLETAADALIIGIGLNVTQHPENTLYPATSLSAELAPLNALPVAGEGGDHPALTEIDLSLLLKQLLNYLGHWHHVMQTKGFALVRAAWINHTQQGRLTIRTPRETLQGKFAGLSEQGHLHLLLADGTEKAISVGDVSNQETE